MSEKRSTETTAFRVKPSPFQKDDSTFIEDEAGEVLVAVSVAGGRVYLENRNLDAEVSFPVAAIMTVLETIKRLASAK